jgi:hypothetical protein
MSRRSVALILAMLGTIRVAAQTPEPTPPPAADVMAFQGRQTPPPPPAPPPAPQASFAGRFSNVRVELTISETMGGATTNKNVVLITSNNHKGSIRSSMQSPTEGNVTLDVDAFPSVESDGRVSVDLVFVYTPQRSPDAVTAGAHSTDIQEQMNVILADGKPLVVSQSADPRGDRKVTVEVTATIMK